MICPRDFTPGPKDRRESILVVEDERMVALDIERLVRGMGYEVIGISDSGEEAVEMARALRPGLVLMDIRLKGAMDGIEAAALIQKIHDTPVIYLTAYADDTTLERARLTGPFGYLIKPFEDRELRLTIEMALYKHRLDAKLLDNRIWLATTLKSIGDAVLTTDPDGMVRFLNPAAEALLQRAEEQARDMPVSEVFRVLDEETLAPLALPLPDPSGGAASRDMLLVTSSGEKLPISSSVAPIANEQGELLGAVFVFRDIAEKKKAEESLRRSVAQLRQTLEETVSALAAMSEKRDLYTAGHQQRVAHLACAMAEEMGLHGDRVNGLRVAGKLHDIGKISVPAEILAKPSRLTPIEMSIMKTHSEAGFEILKRVSFPWPVARMVLQHHERLDGSGYPEGLRGDEIMLEARILAVADVVEAMSSHRPYRATLGLERALDEVGMHKGGLYDPEAVDACLRLFQHKNFTFEAETP
ncbi:MAG: HD domain-containing phosphohydrolase [Desulfovibrio aminophilus]|jgi:PAS domain S-box-containing protein/putative nucleotidyltransferase with HDIG domain|uniref:HD domain-containing phosphohydrolase n=1 Tax=Desulfovibrio aminophilus TaxID=81425 RepID=UPI0039E9DA11